MADIIPIKRHKEYHRQTRRSIAGCILAAKSERPTEILIIGINDEGDVFVKGQPPDPGNALWLMELARKKLVDT